MSDSAVVMFAQLLEDLDDAAVRCAELAARLREDVAAAVPGAVPALRLVDERSDDGTTA
jgi:hypothetical protein